MAGRHAHHLAKQPREVIGVFITQLLGDLAYLEITTIEQATGQGHLQLNEVLNRRMAGQCAVGLGEVKA